MRKLFLYLKGSWRAPYISVQSIFSFHHRGHLSYPVVFILCIFSTFVCSRTNYCDGTLFVLHISVIVIMQYSLLLLQFPLFFKVHLSFFFAVDLALFICVFSKDYIPFCVFLLVWKHRFPVLIVLNTKLKYVQVLPPKLLLYQTIVTTSIKPLCTNHNSVADLLIQQPLSSSSHIQGTIDSVGYSI